MAGNISVNKPGVKMFTRFIRAIRTDISDARTAFELREFRYMLPACIFRRLYRD
jgi:hypothetical protein